MKKGFSLITWVLLAFLVGAVVFVRFISEESHPPLPKMPIAAKSQEEMEVKQQQTHEVMKDKMKAMQNQIKYTMPPKGMTNPDTVEVDSKYFMDNKPGAKGLETLDKAVEKQREAYNAYQAARAKSGAPAKPSLSPTFPPK